MIKVKNPRLQCTECFKTFPKDENTEIKTINGCLEYSDSYKLITTCPHCKTVEKYIVV